MAQTGARTSSADVTTIISLLERCKVHGREKSYQLLLEAADSILLQEPTHCDALSYRGLALYRMGRNAGALAALDRALVAPGAAASRHRQAVRKVRIACLNKISDATPDFFGFPRTAHLYDAGGSAVTRDDLLMSQAGRQFFCGSGRQLIIEEKVDGANLGISINSDHRILFQNRSHYVNVESHAQFAGLQRWQEQHEIELHARLQRNRHVLFGEWCAAKHSLGYTRLPDLFLAFDIYDRQEERFFTRAELHRFLRGSGIPVVPVLAQQVFATVHDLLHLLDTPSRFRDGGFVEGIYIRAEDTSGNGHPIHRCKIVRADFIQGITKHWMSGQMVKNGVDNSTRSTYTGACYTHGGDAGDDTELVTSVRGCENSEEEEGERAGQSVVATVAGQYAADSTSQKYPSTPHLSFSPGVNPDDIQLSAADCTHFQGQKVVITEKLDGGNCCIKDGVVFARTHSSPATHASFSPIKQLAKHLMHAVPPDYELFGENMAGVHSIAYSNLGSFFYLFAIRHQGTWLSWEAVEALAEQLGVPTVPVVFHGIMGDLPLLQKNITGWAGMPSRVGADTTPEGFVIRLAASFADVAFGQSIAKYVRANHIQTGTDWRRTWQKATLNP